MDRHFEPTSETRRYPHAPAWRSLAYRVVAAFALILLGFVLAQGYLVWQQQRITRSLALVTRGYAPLTTLVARLDHDRERVENDVERAFRGGTRPTRGTNSTTQLYVSEMEKSLERARAHVQTARSLAEGPEDQAYFSKIDTQIRTIDGAFRPWSTAALDYVRRLEGGDEVQELQSRLTREGNVIDDEIDTLQRLVDGRADELTRSAERDQERAALISVIFGVSALTLGTLITAGLRLALDPIARLTAQAQRFARGDYAGRVEAGGGDEIGILAQEFNAMAHAIEERDRALSDRAAELNRLTAYLGSVLDSLEEALFVVEGGRITLANPAAGRDWSIQREDQPPEVFGALPPGRHELRTPPDRQYDIRITPFGSAGRVIVATDVTDSTRTRERLARSERLALVGQMLAQITHEVRNPLNALSLNAELLSDELATLDPERRTEAWDILRTVSSEIERLTLVTGHYLQLARRPQAQIGAEDPRALCEDVARLIAAELQRAGTELQLNLEAVGRHALDANQFKQALLNVLRNAMEAGATALDLSVREQDGELHVCLTDNGEGMPQDQTEKSLEPFFSSKSNGTGLGLAITKQILDDHEGTIRIRSRPGAGTTVILAFPPRPFDAGRGDVTDDRSDDVREHDSRRG
jgi:signal transduction histidine kinase